MTMIVIYAGGFQPFHQGHLSSYIQAKSAFPNADFYVATSADVKNRPIPYEDKKFLAGEAGVESDDFPNIVVASPLNPKEILTNYNSDKDIFILVRSERDPVAYTKKDGSPGYYQPFIPGEKLQPFSKHGYVFVTKKKDFDVNGQDVYSGTQVRNMYLNADDTGRKSIIAQLYPKSKQQKKIKQILDTYIGTEFVPPAKNLKENLVRLIQQVRPLLKEANAEQKIKLLKLIKEAHSGALMEGSLNEDPVTQFASKAHDVWRKNFDPTGTKERIKKNSDGSEGNINVPFEKLHPDWKKENLAAGQAAMIAVNKFPRDIEQAAEYIHNEWMKRNPLADYNAAQHVPYDQLPEDEKEKDRVHVRTMMSLSGQQGMAESKSLTKKVKIVKGPDAGKTGWIREIKHGAFKGAPKTYYVDLDDGGQANNLPGTALRLVKDNGVTEAAYPGNIGIMELAKFFDIATLEEKTQFKQLMNIGEKNKAWKLIQKVTGVKLQGKEFAEQRARPLAEEASPMIKPPTNNFDNKCEAFAHAKQHGGKVFKRTYTDPNTGMSNMTFVVKKEPGMAEGSEQAWEVSFSDGEDVIKVHASSKQEAISKATQIAKSQGNPYPSVDWARSKEPGMAEDSEPEGKTVKNSLHTIIRVATHLEQQIDDSEDFAEWESEMIGSVKDQMVKVMDYEISKKEQQGVAEGSLEEIDRRGFLRGLGAAAAVGAAGGAKGQTIGAGENESAWASDYAHNMWQSLAKDNNSYNKWLYDTAKSRAAQYFQYSNGVNFQQTIKASLNEAYAAVKPDFDMFYKIAEKEKEDTGLLGTYMKNRLGNRFGVDMGGQAAQQKYAGSMKQFDLRQQVETFVRVYTDSLNQSLKTIKAQTQQSNVKSTSIDTKQAITDGLTLYYYCKDFPNNQACEMIKSEIGKYIKINNLKDSINSYYSETSNLLDSWKANEKDKWEKLRKNIIDDAPNIIQTMQKLNSNKQPEFESVEQGVAEGSEEINWIKPNFDYEWDEIEFQAKQPQVPADVRNYMAKHFPNKQAWMKSVQHGRPVVVSPDHGQKIRNYPDNKRDLLNALSPQSHDPEGPAKAKRVNALFDKGGPIEMPIILQTEKGLWLIGGKTRLGTANLLKGIPAKVWMIGGEQGVAEGSLADAAKHVKKGALHKQEHIPLDKKIGATKLKSLKAHGTPLERKRANFALNIQGIKEDAVTDLEYKMKPHSNYTAIDHLMTDLAAKHHITPEELHDKFVNKHGMIPDEWIKHKPMSESDEVPDYDRSDELISRLKARVAASKELAAQGKKPETRLDPKTGKYRVDFTAGPDYLDEDPFRG